ncbi:MAG: multidrug efflux MFS transporter [Gemmatimonadetes bacterium]|nr:multidrug efflux MFS transporter [Gemmatimonadota bacterium]
MTSRRPETGASHPDPIPVERLAYKWKVLVGSVFGVFMVVLDTTVVNVAFQTMRAEFGAQISEAQWIISVYVLVLGIATPLAGYSADRYGIKRSYVAGLTIFAFGSLLCGLAPSLGFLIAARALQGFGGGIALPLGSAQLFRAFPAHEQGRALGLFGIVIVFAPAIGPVLGGALVDLDLWRWIFFINVPIGVVGVHLASRLLREQRSPRDHAMDWPGLITEMIGFGAILYAASIAEIEGWLARGTVVWLAIGLVGLVAFVYVELRVAKDPLLDVRLFGRRVFLLSCLVGYVTIVALFGAEFLMPLYLQMMRGIPALDAGLMLLPMAVTAGIATPIAGLIYDRTGPRPLLVTGFTLLAFNTWQFAMLGADTAIPWILALLAIRGIALGLTVQTTFVSALSIVSGAALPRATSLVNATRNVVQSIGVALLATVLASTLSPLTREIHLEVQHSLEAGGEAAGVCPLAARPDRLGAAATAAESERPGEATRSDQNAGRRPGIPERHDAAALRTACAEGLAGFARAYRLTLYASLLALLLGALLPGWPGRWGGRTSDHHTP